MNIKEHIEAGHYQTDDKGRALVPMKGGLTATILATDKGYDTIWAALETGACLAWRHDGENWGPHRNCRDEMLVRLDLLPPSPRKVKVTAWGVFGKPSNALYSAHRDYAEADKNCAKGVSQVVELVGEIEEPWCK